jgi:hypothetical protein
MAAKITTTGGNTTISFEFTLPNAKMVSIVDIIGKQIWHNEGVIFTDGFTIQHFYNLTNQQKVDVLFDLVRDGLMTYVYRDAAKIANETAKSNIDATSAL